MSRTYTVYGLIDPRTNAIRYVGCTAKSLDARCQDHVGRRLSSSAPVHAWVGELFADGLRPMICVLAVAANAHQGRIQEQAWIHALRRGPLLNIDSTARSLYRDARRGFDRVADTEDLPLLDFARRTA